MPQTQRLYPYNFSSGLHLRLADPYDPSDESHMFSWGRAATGGDDAESFDLRADREWKSLHVELEAHLSEEELGRLLPKGSALERETALVVSVRCPTTKYRHAVKLTPSAGGVWKGDLLLARRDLRSRVELQPRLIRTSTLPSAPEELASHVFAIVAEGRPVRLFLDDVDRPIRGTVRVMWEDFRSSTNEWKKRHHNDLYFLEISDEMPILWLNERHVSLRAVLHDKSRKGINAGLQELMNGWLAEVVWLQLFTSSVGAIHFEPEVDEVVAPLGWRRDVLKAFVAKMYPDLQDETAWLRKLAELWRSPDEVGDLTSRAATVVQTIVRSQQRFTASLRAVEES